MMLPAETDLKLDEIRLCVSAATTSVKILPSNQSLHHKDARDGLRGQRLLRSQDEDDDSKLDSTTNTNKSPKDEERGIIDGLYQDDYQEWFDDRKTPDDVADEIGYNEWGLLENPLKRRIYRGYKRFYENACDNPRNRKICEKDDEEN
ncbi:unnamed protein product [Phytophthora lilii]|uniref:RxLR effector protein n=1 Tax=Phytophthora lilii TaxID=2077276 RepID=A0A9W6XMJ3_9STRA|nr:unnamed protein product [Phytophthora lilii]